MIYDKKWFFLNILYVVRLEPTISTVTAIRSIQMAKRDSDVYMIRKNFSLPSEINTFHNVCKSKISFTEFMCAPPPPICNCFLRACSYNVWVDVV